MPPVASATPRLEKPTAAPKLRKAMREAKISKRGLAKELAKETGQDAEATRIAIHRWLRGGVNPGPTNQRHLEKVLKKPKGYFSVRPTPKIPKDQQVLQRQVATARGEAARLESRVAELERELRRARGETG